MASMVKVSAAWPDATASAPVPFETLLQKVKEARKGAPVYDSTWVTFESLIMEIERLREEVASLKSKT